MADNGTVGFNLTKFCYLAGNAVGVSEAYRIILLVVFSIIGFLILFTNTIALLTVLKKRAQYLKKGKMFMLSLIIIDLLSGCTVIPLFITELSKHRDVVNCPLSSLRVLFFGYFLSCRILTIFFISLHTYIKMDKANTMLEYRFDYFAYIINIAFVWMPGIIFILAIGFSQVKTDKVLGTVVFIPVVVMVAGSVACYIMVLRTIKRAKDRHESDIYREGATYIKKVLIWFLLTNIPLGICGLVLLVYAFYIEEKKRDNHIVQQIYVVCLAVTSIDAMINPYLFLQKHSDLNEYVTGKFKKISSRRSKSNDEQIDITNDRTYFTFQHENKGFEDQENVAAGMDGTSNGI